MKPEHDPISSWKLIRDIQKGQIVDGQYAHRLPSQNSTDETETELVQCITPTDSENKEIENKSNKLVSVIPLLGLILLSFFQMAPLPFTLKILNFVAIAAVCAYLIVQNFQITRGKDEPESNSSSKTIEELERLQDLNWELREREERYRSMADAFGDMSMDRTNDGKICFLNSSFAEFMKIEADQLIGKEFPLKIDSVEPLTKTSRHEKVSIVKLQVDQRDRWLAWLDLPIRNERTNESLIRTVARDVTQHKLVEQDLRKASKKAESASKAKTQFLANVSHEMRTPLNGILGMSGLLADSELSSEQITYVDAIHDSGKALLTLIEDILDMTLVEAGRLEIRNAPMDPLRLVEDVCELLSSRAHAKNISIGSFVSAQVPEVLESDTGRLRQILINLIGNAIKFTESGGVYVECCAFENQDGNTFLEFKVNDTGPGIAEEEQNAIFEEFSQADSESTRKHGGAGLGLAISRRIVEEMGGTIELKSEIGVGSVFAVCLPITAKLEASSDHAMNANAAPVVSLVTGDAITAQVLECNLAESSGQICVHASLSKCKSALQDICAGTLFIDADCVGSDDNLDDLADEIKKVVLLKPEERSQLQEYLDNGFDGYLIKPIRKSSLQNMISLKPRPQPHDDRNISASKQWADGIRSNQKAKSVLLAEDNEINALLARSILEKAGHAVTRAKNGRETLALLEERMDNDPFDLLLLDLQMPELDGIAALENIRSGEEATGLPPLPVYILTADEQEESRILAYDKGATGFLTKPLDPSMLLGLLDDTIASS